MAVARLIALAALAAGCANASADGAAPGPIAPPAPGAGDVMQRLRVTLPGDWERLPTVEATATAAAAKVTAAATAVEAWGDPAAGCYAIALDVRGRLGEPIDASRRALARALAPLGADPAAMPAPVGDVLDAQLPLAAAELAGGVRVRMLRAAGKPQAAVLACAGNAREPARCKAQCDALFAAMAPPVAVP